MKNREELPYEPGNFGDLIKHTWLAEAASFLARRGRGKPFRYADSFCGDPLYSLNTEIRGRFERAKGIGYLALQRDLLEKGQYLGSAALVKRLCDAEKIPAEIFVSDRNPGAVKAYVAQGGYRVFEPPIGNGYDVLGYKEDYDLILLDPPADFIPLCHKDKTLVPRLVQRSRRSSLLVKVLNWADHAESYGRFRQALNAEAGALDASVLVGRLPPHPFRETESKYWHEVVFIFQAGLAPEEREGLTASLKAATATLWNFLGGEIGGFNG